MSQFLAVPWVTMVATSGDQAIENESDQADIDQRDHDVGEARRVPRIPDEETDADAAGEHLRRHDGEPRETDTDAQAREDVGRRRRQHDLARRTPAD